MANVVGTEYPKGSRVVLWRRDGGWSVFSHYPVGANIPATAMKFDNRMLRDLDSVHARILAHHQDHSVTPNKTGPTLEKMKPIPVGTLIDYELQENGWKMNGTNPKGGFFGRLGPFSTLADAFTYLKDTHSEK